MKKERSNATEYVEKGVIRYQEINGEWNERNDTTVSSSENLTDGLRNEPEKGFRGLCH